MSYRGASTVRGPLHFNGTASPGLSAASEGRIYFDGTTFQMSSNGGAFETIATVGAAGGWTDDGTVVRLTTVTDGVGIGIAAIAASSKLEVLGDATRKDVSLQAGSTATGTGGVISLAAGAGGTGTGGSITVAGGTGTTAGGQIIFSTAATTVLGERWRVSNAGHFLAGTDNAYDIGASGATRPRRVYVGTEVVVGNTVTIGTASVTGSAGLSIGATTGNITLSPTAGDLNSNAENVNISAGSGTGSAAVFAAGTNNISIDKNTSSISFVIGGTNQWFFQSGEFVPYVSAGNPSIGRTGVTERPGTIYLATGVTIGSGNTTLTSTALTGSAGINVNAAASNFLGLGNTSNQAVQIGGSDSATHDATPGVIFIQPADGVGSGSYIAVYGSDANASQPGGFVDIRGGNGFATGDRAAGDLYIYGGGANGSTTAGPVYCEGGFGGTSAPGGLFEIKGGSTTLAAALAGDATIDGGTALSAADNGRVLIGTVNARSVTIGRAGISTTIVGVTDMDAAVGLGAIATVTGNTTLDDTNAIVLVDATGGVVTITLPAVAGVTRRHYTIKKIDSSGNAVTIDANGAETIDGATTQTLAAQYDALEIVSNGTAWFIV